MKAAPSELSLSVAVPIAGVRITANASAPFGVPSWLRGSFFPSPLDDRPCAYQNFAGAVSEGVDGETSDGPVMENWGTAPTEAPPGVDATDYTGLTNAEKNLLWRFYNQLRAAIGAQLAGQATAGFVLRLKEIADDAAAFAALEISVGAFNGPQDAVRHAMWQCQMTKEFGVQTATEWGNAHEQGQPLNAEVRMDLFNNEIGRQVGTSPSTCETGVRDALRRRILRIAPLEWSQNGLFVPNPPSPAPLPDA